MKKLQIGNKSMTKLNQYNKFNQFFSSNRKQYIYQEQVDTPFAISLSNKLKRSSSIVSNLQSIQEKSSIKGKIQTYLLDSRKIGVLDQTNKANKKLLTKINQSQKKIPHNQIQQNRLYLTKLKNQYSGFYNKNIEKQRQIHNIQANITQSKQKIIFYQNILSMTLQDQQSLLITRQEKIKWVKFQQQILKNMKQRLKLINQNLKKKIKNDLSIQRTAIYQNDYLNQQMGHTKQSTDKKQYAMHMYKSLENNKTQSLIYKVSAAQTNINIQSAALILKKKQNQIVIMERDTYNIQVIQNTHKKLMKQLRIMKLHESIINAARNRILSYYKEYQKAETLMKMFTLDSQFQVSKSYDRSFHLTKQLNAQVQQKQNKIKKLQKRNQQLQQQWLIVGFSGVQLNHFKNQEDLRIFKKKISQRHKKCIRNLNLINRIKFWVKKQEQKLDLKPSKKSGLSEHFKAVIQELKIQVKSFEDSIEKQKISKQKIKQSEKNNNNQVNIGKKSDKLKSNSKKK